MVVLHANPPEALLPGGGAVEMELAVELSKWARTLPGEEASASGSRSRHDPIERLPFQISLRDQDV